MILQWRRERTVISLVSILVALIPLWIFLIARYAFSLEFPTWYGAGGFAGSLVYLAGSSCGWIWIKEGA